MTKTWLAVERLENWEVDRSEGFRRFGIPSYLERRAKTVEVDDRVIFYVSSGISCFADIRRITSPTVGKLGLSGAYDEGFPFHISTEPVLSLERDF